MDIGTAITVCGGCFSVVAIVYKIFPSRNCKDAVHCSDHSGMIEAIGNLKGWMKTIDGKMDQLLKNGKGQ